jgi:hypothetical protein
VKHETCKPQNVAAFDPHRPSKTRHATRARWLHDDPSICQGEQVWAGLLAARHPAISEHRNRMAPRPDDSPRSRNVKSNPNLATQFCKSLQNLARKSPMHEDGGSVETSAVALMTLLWGHPSCPQPFAVLHASRRHTRPSSRMKARARGPVKFPTRKEKPVCPACVSTIAIPRRARLGQDGRHMCSPLGCSHQVSRRSVSSEEALSFRVQCLPFLWW